jgi:hypothetical protein
LHRLILPLALPPSAWSLPSSGAALMPCRHHATAAGAAACSCAVTAPHHARAPGARGCAPANTPRSATSTRSGALGMASNSRSTSGNSCRAAAFSLSLVALKMSRKPAACRQASLHANGGGEGGWASLSPLDACAHAHPHGSAPHAHVGECVHTTLLPPARSLAPNRAGHAVIFYAPIPLHAGCLWLALSSRGAPTSAGKGSGS